MNDPHWGHAHALPKPAGPGVVANGWGDCCGIPIPSVFGAAAAATKEAEGGVRLSGPAIKPVPFD